MRFFLPVFFLLLLSASHLEAQNVTVSGASVGNGSYPTLTAAFTAINGGSQAGAVISISITANTTEVATAVLNQSSGPWTSLTITPSGNRIIQGTIVTQLIDFNGADNVTIDGLNDGTNSLIIDNTSSGASNGTIRLLNDARFNTITNCTLKGSSKAANAAVVFFSAADATLQQGNDNNTISNCTIRESSNGYPIEGILSFMVSTSPTTRWNQNIQITNNNIINCLTDNASSSTIGVGIHLSTGSSDWTISGNSIYYSASVSSSGPMTNAFNYGIRVSFASAVNISISNNYIGGTAASCGGAPLTWSNNTFGNKFCGIAFTSSNAGTPSNIQGNTISNIVLNTNSSQSTVPYTFSGIDIEGGLVNVGTTSGNLIGSTSTTGNITVSVSSNVGAFVVGIGSSGIATTPTISNNTISGITVTNPSSSGAYVHFRGIYITAQPATISGNTIGSTSLPLSIQNLSGATSTVNCIVSGISIASSSSISATGNTISNLNYNASAGSTNVFQVVGIQAINGLNNFSSNTISNIYNSNQSTQSGSLASVIGILDVTSVGTGETISQNTINNISNTNAGSAAVHVYGILFGVGGSNHSISRNKIYDLKFSSTNTTNSSGLDGIRLINGVLTISNNMISIGNGLTNNPFINGINIQFGAPGVYYNSVVLTGTASGSVSTNCIRMESGSSGTNFRDNIFYNNRTSATGANNSVMYCASSTQVGNLTACNYNDLYNNSSNTSLVIVTGTGTYSNLPAWQTSGFGKDLNSISQAAVFLNIANDLHLDPSTSCNFLNKGTPVTITVDYDNETRHPVTPDMGADEIGNAVWTGVTSSDWHVSSNWSPAVVPTSSSDVLIPSGTPFSCTVTSANADAHSVTINSTASFSMINSRILTVISNSCGNGTFTVNGTFSPGSVNEEVAFNGVAIVSGTLSFNIVSTNNSLTFSTNTTVNKRFRIDAGGYVNTNAPIYTTGSSTLQYNTGGTYGRSLEWSTLSGAGYPYHVQISNNTTLDLGNGGTGTARRCGGDLTIDAGSALTMNNGGNQMTDDLTVIGNVNNNGTLTQSVLATAPYNDINVSGNWTRGAGGVFNPNCRGVFFNSTTIDQTVTVTGGGTETFNYVGINKTGRKLILGANTDMKISATSGCGLGFDYLTITNGDIDLQGRTLYLEGPTGLTPGTNVMNLKVLNGTRSILSGVAGGIVSISSTLNCKTLLIADGGGSGKILFGNNVEVRDASGEIDFGTGNLGTINYILRINNGGAVVGNAAYYAQGSKLIFSTGTLYDIVATQQSWETGTLGTTPGVPWDVEVNTASTDVRTSDNFDRCVRNNLSILNGTLELGAPGFLLCNLTVGGNWTRNNSGTAFIPNQNKVTFNSSVNASLQLQTLTMSGGGNETFYDLEENNSLGLDLAASTNAWVSNHLYLTSGLVNTGTNEVYVTTSNTAAITFDVSNNAADSWVNGYLRRKTTTGNYDFPIGTSATASAAGYELIRLNFSSNTNVDNLRVSFTIDNSSSSSNEPYAVAVNGTPITDRLNAGWWTVRPYNAALALVGSPTCSYDIFLNERGHTNSQLSPQQYAVIKRDASYCYDACGTAWTDCGSHNNLTQTETGGTAHAERSGFTCTSFSDWAIGFASIILPIELTTFDVTSENGDAILTWLTSAEYNSDFFAVERSSEGINFSEIGRVNAAGYSEWLNDYSFIDPGIKKLSIPKIYYRLRMVDLDQSFKYSQVREVDLNGSMGQDVIIIYPNPFIDNASILWNAFADATATIQLVDVGGRMILEKKVEISQGANVISLPEIPSLAAGVYFLQIISGKEVLTQKLVKEK